MKEKLEALTNAMDALFRFKIGDAVCLANDVESCLSEQRVNGGPRRYADWHAGARIAIIADRFVEQCHGGVQFSYGIRRTDGVLVRFPEFELRSVAEAEDAIRAMLPQSKSE